MANRRQFITGIATVSTVGIAGCAGTEKEAEFEEEIPFTVIGTYGPETQRNHQWEDEKLIFEAGDSNAEEDYFQGSAVNAELVLSTESPIDMSSVAEIIFSFRQTSIKGSQDTSFFTVSSERGDVYYDSVKHYVGESDEESEEDILDASSNIEGALYFKDRDVTERTDETINVVDVSGDKYIAFGVNIGSSNPQEMTLEIFELYGVDDTGERIFELDFSNEMILPA